jgi:flavodoxin
MKKGTIIAVVIVIIAIIGLATGIIMLVTTNNSENNENIPINEENKKENEVTNNITSNNSKILVAVFSRAGENYAVGNVEVGNTEVMANYIVDYIGADFFKIEPVTPYPESYEECTEVAQQEKNQNARPEIKNKITNFDDYDTVFIGYPNWWGDMPMIVYTFLESYDFSGKKVIPFNTHEGSGASGTYNTIKNKLSNSNVITNGLAIRGANVRSSKSEVESWLKELGF